MNTPLDKAISQFDQALRAVTGAVGKTPRQSPASSIETDALSDQEKTEAVRLMRVNHCGEVCAQALYQAQALVAKSPEVANHMRTAAIEEVDHLSWTEERIRELDGHVSYLNPFWYLASFGMGAVTGMLGDKINLGFVAGFCRRGIVIGARAGLDYGSSVLAHGDSLERGPDRRNLNGR